MDRFPRGTLPPSAFVPMTAKTPTQVEPPRTTLAANLAAKAEAPRGSCDLSMTCPQCSTLMQPEHAHYRCLTCGYRDSCCF